MELFTVLPDAEDDLGEILAYVAEDSFDACVRLLTEFESCFAELGQTPFMGHLRPDLVKNRPLRFWALRDYLIAYDPSVDPAAIVGVVHGRRGVVAIARILAGR